MADEEEQEEEEEEEQEEEEEEVEQDNGSGEMHNGVEGRLSANGCEDGFISLCGVVSSGGLSLTRLMTGREEQEEGAEGDVRKR